MDAANGRVLYEKEGDLRLPPASTTKVVTAIIALESGRKLNELLKVSKAATRVPASKLYLRPGQTMTIEDLLYGILLSSANDASLVLAEGIGGSVERFSALMTRKAHQVGAINSHFTNPHGLTAPDHYSTARDLAILFRYAMRDANFREIVQTKIGSVRSNYVVRKKTVARRISVRNHNRLLWNFDGALGGKTGYTHAAQKCFVGAVSRDGVTLIVSILGARDQWGDTKKLLQYGFDNYNGLKAEAQRTEAKRKSNEKTAGQSEDSATTAATARIEANNDGSYVLQLGAFRERERAESLLRQIHEKGFDAFVEEPDLTDGQGIYRVRLGPFTELREARDIAQQILNNGVNHAIILPVPSEPENVGDSS